MTRREQDLYDKTIDLLLDKKLKIDPAWIRTLVHRIYHLEQLQINMDVDPEVKKETTAHIKDQVEGIIEKLEITKEDVQQIMES